MFRNLTQLSAEGIPTIAVVYGNSTAGGAYVPGMSDHIVMIEERSKVFLAGPPLVKAATGEITDRRELPWYLTALLLSQPLHFGDYGGLALKLLWTALDLLSIWVLWSGLVLWWKRRHVTAEQKLAGLRDRQLAASAN